MSLPKEVCARVNYRAENLKHMPPFPADPNPCYSRPPGRVAEWFKAAVLKTAVGGSLPWVRIPPRPPGASFFVIRGCSPMAFKPIGISITLPVFRGALAVLLMDSVWLLPQIYVGEYQDWFASSFWALACLAINLTFPAVLAIGAYVGLTRIRETWVPGLVTVLIFGGVLLSWTWLRTEPGNTYKIAWAWIGTATPLVAILNLAPWAYYIARRFG